MQAWFTRIQRQHDEACGVTRIACLICPGTIATASLAQPSLAAALPCSKDMVEDIRLGALECMAALYYAQGRFLSIGVQETVAVTAKYCSARWGRAVRTRRGACSEGF